MKRKIEIISSVLLGVLMLFSVHTPVFSESDSSDQKYFFDEHYRIDKDKGFTLEEKEEIEDSDPHYGWSLGSLYVSGYTQRTTGKNEEPVFLKNSGDKVVLGFQLKQNINKLNGDKNLSIAVDKKGFDAEFEIPKTNFGRGTLIIRHTDYQNSKKEPQVYTNYLSAKEKVNANTVVELNEEGDYEVALDYVIKKDPRKILGKSLLPTYSDYTIRVFKFSIRNGNSMVFPFDCETGEELSSKSFTENGFRIDLAKSHYLKVFVKKEVINGTDSTDTRQNRPAKDGDVFTDEGIYTISVEDPSTEQVTTKMIYVGTDARYKAFVTTGLSLEKIDAQIAEGATIADDGTLVAAGDNSGQTDTVLLQDSDGEKDNSGVPIIPMVIIVVIAIALITIIKGRKKK